MLEVIRTQLHTISQLSPILGPRWVAPGNIRLSSSWWPGGHSGPSCVLKFKAKEKAGASFLAIPAAFPVVTLTEPALHYVFFKEPVVGDERGWRLIGQACCTPIALSVHTAGTGEEGEEESLVRHPFPSRSPSLPIPYAKE